MAELTYRAVTRFIDLLEEALSISVVKGYPWLANTRAVTPSLSVTMQEMGQVTEHIRAGVGRGNFPGHYQVELQLWGSEVDELRLWILMEKVFTFLQSISDFESAGTPVKMRSDSLVRTPADMGTDQQFAYAFSCVVILSWTR